MYGRAGLQLPCRRVLLSREGRNVTTGYGAERIAVPVLVPEVTKIAIGGTELTGFQESAMARRIRAASARVRR
jgi:hypothetical protein